MILKLLELFWIFFKIGLFTFGGGYAMIPLLDSYLVGGGFISENLLYDLIGLAESTPGPIAVNMATFIGMNQLGFLGALFATIGVVLPSFLIILLIAAFGSKFLESKWVVHALEGLKPAVIGLIFSVSVALFLRLMFPNLSLPNFTFDLSQFQWQNIIIFAILLLIVVIRKKTSPVQIIFISAVLGIIVYLIF